MSIMEISETDKMLAGFYKRFVRFNDKARDKAEGDMHKYLENFLHWASFAMYSDSDLGNLCIDILKRSMKGNDYSLMQAVMNFMNA